MGTEADDELEQTRYGKNVKILLKQMQDVNFEYSSSDDDNYKMTDDELTLKKLNSMRKQKLRQLEIKKAQKSKTPSINNRYGSGGSSSPPDKLSQVKNNRGK